MIRCAAPVFLLGLLAAVPAHADQAYPAIQFVCAPQIGYFSANTMTVWNVDPEQLPSSPTLAMMHVGSIGHVPYKCSWKDGELTARLTYFHQAQASGFCGAVEYGTIEIDWNGHPLAVIEQNYCGNDRQTVTVQGVNFPVPGRTSLASPSLGVEHCVGVADQDSGTFKCDTHYFDLAKLR